MSHSLLIDRVYNKNEQKGPLTIYSVDSGASLTVSRVISLLLSSKLFVLECSVAAYGRHDPALVRLVRRLEERLYCCLCMPRFFRRWCCAGCLYLKFTVQATDTAAEQQLVVAHKKHAATLLTVPRVLFVVFSPPAPSAYIICVTLDTSSLITSLPYMQSWHRSIQCDSGCEIYFKKCFGALATCCSGALR